MSLEIRPIKSFGAVITGVDLRSVSDADFARIAYAFDQHAVLIIPKQGLDDDAQAEFTARFGPPEKRQTKLQVHQRDTGIRPEIVDLSNIVEGNKLMAKDDPRAMAQDGNMLWHTDGSFRAVPAMASILTAREVAPEGGETEFADCRAAWDALPKDKQESLEGLIAEHSAVYSRSLIGHKFTAEEEAQLPPALQTVVRTHPVTGRKSIYVASHASHIVGWPIEKGRALLKELMEFCTQPQFVYQHHWSVGDLIMWDNRCTLHRLRPWNSQRYKRVMRRTMVAGKGPTVIDGVPIAVG